MTTRTTVLTALLLTACGGGDNNLPDQDSIDDVRDRVEAIGGALGNARTGLDVLGLMPDYTCDAPRSSWVSDTVAEVAGILGCGRRFPTPSIGGPFSRTCYPVS